MFIHVYFELELKLETLFLRSKKAQSSLRLLDGRHTTNNVWYKEKHRSGKSGLNYRGFIRSNRACFNITIFYQLMHYCHINSDSAKFNKIFSPDSL